MKLFCLIEPEDKRVKFKLDENIPFILKKIIESHNKHRVDSVFHKKITGISDKSLINHCLKEKRILITLDNDFSNKNLFPKGSYYGIIIIRSKTQGKKAIEEIFEKFITNYSLEDSRGKIIIIEINQIRIKEA